MMNAGGVGLSPLQRRLAYTALRRSMLEMDRILERFLHTELSRLDDSQCERLLTLLQQPDADLLEWLAGEPPPGVDGEMVDRLRPYRGETPSGR